jgi:hypothetical protein
VSPWVAAALAAGAAAVPPMPSVPDAGAVSPIFHFGPGESLTYTVKYLGAFAGTARIDVGSAASRQGVTTWPLVVTVRSGGLAETLYPVRDRYVDWWDPAVALPVESSLSAAEGGERSGFHIRFERGRAGPDGGVAADVQLWSDGERTEELRSVEPRTQDILSAIFWLRTLPLAVGDHYELPIFMGKAQWPLGATVLDRETVVTELGPSDCVHLRLSASIKGRLGNRRDLDAYFSADARHLPVLLDSELVIGHLRVGLTDVRGNAVAPSH